MRTGWWSKLRPALTAAALAGLFVYAGFAGLTGAPSLESQAWAQVEGKPPGEALGNRSDSEFWRDVRAGKWGTVSVPDKMTGMLIQSEGENWRAVRNGPLSVYGGCLLAATIVILAAFFLARGRIRVEAGLSGKTIERFNAIERFTHWLTATCFIVLALTGLNIMFGRYALAPILGPELFATLTMAGKWAHNVFAFGFMIGIVLMFVLWVRHNLPNRHDVIWILKGGGMFVKGVHPPAKKFNAGQKLIFWGVVLGGLSVSVSGIALLFPFQIPIFSDSFAILNLFGLGLPTDIAPIQEMQLSQIWHGIVGLLLIALIIAHIYIGTLGMEGAFDAMGGGQVDENWAREHHDIWAAEIMGEVVSKHGGEVGDD